MNTITALQNKLNVLTEKEDDLKAKARNRAIGMQLRTIAMRELREVNSQIAGVKSEIRVKKYGNKVVVYDFYTQDGTKLGEISSYVDDRDFHVGSEKIDLTNPVGRVELLNGGYAVLRGTFEADEYEGR